MVQQQLIPDEAMRFRILLQEKGLCTETISVFQAIIKKHYVASGRHFPFCEPAHYQDPYRVVVSEIMLQQTQADRVVEKYLAFIDQFPTFEALAAASTEDVLKQWIGLGYNRRALALKAIAERVTNELGGILPRTPEELRRFKGIGPNTAASIAAFAFNAPVVFIETNIRTVYTHFFFGEERGGEDTKILPIVEATLDRTDPRTWYYALMDYGVKLKREGKKAGRKQKIKAGSKPQPFKGSNRELRGQILKQLLDTQMDLDDLASILDLPRERVEPIIMQLKAEGFLKNINGFYRIT
jgi:A/G-specific adenine glycosylase